MVPLSRVVSSLVTKTSVTLSSLMSAHSRSVSRPLVV